MSPSFESFKLWLLRTARENSVVQGEATMETLRRFRIFASVTLIINVVYIASFWHGVAHPDDSLKSRHAYAIVLSHVAMATAMLLLGLLAHSLCRRKQTNSAHAITLQLLICISSFGFAMAITVIDQTITETMTTFVLISLLIAMLSLMRPVMSIPLFVGVYAVFFELAGWTLHNAEIVSRVRTNGRDILLVSIVTSVIIWRQYVASILLRREVARAHQALADKQVELAFLATHDPLTGLFNRREFMRLGEMELVRARRDPAPTHLIILDIDHFKDINDHYGHPEGDLVLIKTAAVLSGSLRETDILARLGGEEFILLLPRTSKEAALKVAEKIRAGIERKRHEAEGDHITFCASFGVTGLEIGQSALLEDLYLAADQALYQAKRLGRNRVEFAETQFIHLPPKFVRSEAPT